MIMQESQHDLQYLYNALLNHPYFCFCPDALQEFRQLYRSLRNTAEDMSSLINAASILTGYFHDGHTNIEIPYTSNDFCIPLECDWQGNKLVLARDFKTIQKGSRIEAINGQSISDICNKMASRIPHENEYLVMSRMIHYPYRNYNLFSDLTLQWLFGSNEMHTIVFGHHGKTNSLHCPMEKYRGHLDFTTDKPVNYEINGKAATFYLKQCVFNESYIQSLDALAKVCKQREIDTLVLDLTQNMGGDASVIDEFIHRIDTPQYYRYEMIDCTNGIQKQITSRSIPVANPKVHHIFPKRIFCKVSYDTFSSARTFAVTLKDNKLATIIGTPTGGKPSSFGKPAKGILPNSKIRYRVSTSLFLRPNKNADNDISLFPDI